MLRRVKNPSRQSLCRSFTAIITSSLLAVSLAGSSLADDLERGEELYGLCAQCHGDTGDGNQNYLAPQISGLDKWYVLSQLKAFRSGARGTHFDDIGGMRMRPMALTLRSDADVEAVAAYVASLPETTPAPVLSGGDAAKGQTLYTTCAACHGPDGKGIEGLKGPELNHASDWYLLVQMRNFRAGTRGGDPAKDPTGAQMRVMAMTLADEQAVRDVIAYIVTLSK